ncbi:MAG: hypothetical protein AB1295_03845 [Candidatus Micrarchaeota archaeon]
MRYVLLLLTAALLLGCTSAPQAPSGQQPSGGIPGIPGTGAPAEACSPAYSFSELEEGTLSETTTLVATVTCAAGKRMAVMLDGEEATALIPETNATTPLSFRFAPKKDGPMTVTVEVDGVTVHSREWEVAPLGYSGTYGTENDGVSFKEWRAMAVDVENAINPDRVSIFMKRLDFRSQPGTQLLVEIRGDSGGSPGPLIAESRRPMNVSTLTENWVHFDFPRPTLAPGTYWIVVKVDQTESISTVSDTTYIHMTPNDKQQPGNDYTRVMKLSVDEKTGKATETSWQPLPYDRIYSIVLSSG